MRKLIQGCTRYGVPLAVVALIAASLVIFYHNEPRRNGAAPMVATATAYEYVSPGGTVKSYVSPTVRPSSQIVDITQLVGVSVGDTSPNYCATVFLVGFPRNARLVFTARYGWFSNAVVSLPEPTAAKELLPPFCGQTYYAPSQIGWDRITVKLLVGTRVVSTMKSGWFQVSPPPQRPA